MDASIRKQAGEGGLERVVVDTPLAEAEIYLLGGNVTRFRPKDVEQSLLWLSPKSAFATGKAIRGGVPICWPWFGPREGAPQHGFARTSVFTLLDARREGDDAVVELGLAPADATRAHFPHPFGLRYTVTVGRSLTLSLAVENEGAASFSYTDALHSYFAVSDVRGVSVLGLEGASYLDKVADGAREEEGAAPIALTAETDRVYVPTAATCTIVDPGWKRRVTIAKSGSQATVLWNPWQEKSAAMADIGPDAWQGMVCVETANAGGQTITLEPGASHATTAVLSIEKE